MIRMSVEFEEKLAKLRKDGDEDGAKALLATVAGGRGSMLPRIVKCSYKQLNLMCTTSLQEIRKCDVGLSPSVRQHHKQLVLFMQTLKQALSNSSAALLTTTWSATAERRVWLLQNLSHR